MRALLAGTWLLLAVGCGAETSGGIDAGTADSGSPQDSGGAQDGGDVGAMDATAAAGFPTKNHFDPAAAERGRAVLHEGGLAQAFLPKLAMESLWLVWDGVPRQGETYWAMFRQRYGLFESPDTPYPLGIDQVGTSYSLNCLVCHATKVAGVVYIGAGNDHFDLQGFFDDLVALNARAPMPVPLPYVLQNKTGAAGVNDAFGLGMELSKLYGPAGVNINTQYGFQQAPAWWTMRFKAKIYTDGSGQTRGYRPMMATLLAFGLSYSELMAMAPAFDDLHNYLLSLEAPEWPFDAPEAVSVARGAQVYDDTCAQCHGSLAGTPNYPDTVVPHAEVGTDALRASQFTDTEATWINAGWFGEVPMSATDGYLAPPLVGVWATAPYFHNGSVPSLAAVLDPSIRPGIWRRTGSERSDYDPVSVGWRYQMASSTDGNTLIGRKVFDDSRPGLGSGGHLYGASLSTEQRSDLINYLKGL